jgi:hypothetical protein
LRNAVGTGAFRAHDALIPATLLTWALVSTLPAFGGRQSEWGVYARTMAAIIGSGMWLSFIWAIRARAEEVKKRSRSNIR